ncbi:MAG: Hsp20/alpha crystallin family protein [Acidobacteriota bacterium]
MPSKGDPLRELLNLQRRVNRLFEEIIQPERSSSPLQDFTWIPPADVYEDAARYVVEVEIPGVPIEDIEVTAEGRLLRVAGERRASQGEDQECVQRMERYFGPFLREFSFPDEIDAGAVEAALKDGLLTIVLPRKNTRKSIRVK